MEIYWISESNPDPELWSSRSKKCSLVYLQIDVIFSVGFTTAGHTDFLKTM
jgi:hypothetical protein